MSTADIARDLVDMCRKGQNLEAIDKYYAQDIVSVESMSAPGMPAEMKGLDAIRKKNEWLENHEVHGAQVNGPFVGENQFAVEFHFDVTQKGSGNRAQLSEMALYTVKDGKIVRERFYYNQG